MKEGWEYMKLGEVCEKKQDNPTDFSTFPPTPVNFFYTNCKIFLHFYNPPQTINY